jgi:hypothetical protein
MAGGRRCTVCDHPRLREITSELMARRSYRQIQSKFKISKSALDRHVARHIPQALRKLTAELTTAAEVGESVLTQMGKLNARALRILEQAEAAEDRGIALQAIRECRRNLELIARLTGELAPGAVTGAAAGPLQVTVQYVERQALAVVAPTALPLPDGQQANGGAANASNGNSTESAKNVLEPAEATCQH